MNPDSITVPLATIMIVLYLANHIYFMILEYRISKLQESVDQLLGVENGTNEEV